MKNFKRAAGLFILRNLNASRDWGHARDYAEGMMMLQQKNADDFVFATGKTHTVRYFVEEAFFSIKYKDFMERKKFKRMH